MLAQLGVDDPILNIAKQLEEAALVDPYFVDRKLYPMWISIQELSIVHLGFQQICLPFYLLSDVCQAGLHNGKKCV